MTVRRPILWLAVAGLVLVLAANAHLIYVAVTSQPGCVTHSRGDASPGSATFSAAKPSC